MTQEHTESTDIQDALNPLADEGPDAIDPSQLTRLASRATDATRSGTLPLAGGGLLLLGAVKQLRRRRGRAILQGLAGASLLAVGLRQRKASADELNPLEGDQGVSDVPGATDEVGGAVETEETGIDAGDVADEVGSSISDRVPLSGEDEDEDESEADSESDALDTDEQVDVHVTGAPESGDPAFGDEFGGDRDETDTTSGDESGGDDQLGQDETDADADADAGDDAETNFGADIENASERDGESDDSIDGDELSEENEDKDEDIRGP